MSKQGIRSLIYCLLICGVIWTALIIKILHVTGCSMVSHHYGTQTVNRGAVLPGCSLSIGKALDSISK